MSDDMEKNHIWDSVKMKWVKPHNWSIEYDHEYEWYSVYAFGVYGRGSLLEGQAMKVFKDSFFTEEEALKAYPQATVGFVDPNNTFDHLPDNEMSARDEEEYFTREDY